ncbi:MAG: hypothetical protein WA705_11595 [Candidatus Ozemobacteraceae bacterium]
MDKKKLVLVGSLLLGGLIALIILLFASRNRSSSAHNEETNSAKTSTHISTSGRKGSLQTPSASGNFLPGEAPVSNPGGAHSVSSPGPVSAPNAGSPIPEHLRASSNSSAEIEAIAAGIMAHRQKVREESLAWAEKFIMNDNLASNTREVYRLRLIPNLRSGHKLLESKDFAGALREYDKALVDPHASPVAKFLIYDYMKHAAIQLKDVDRYLEACRAQASLIKEADLTVLSIKKTPDAIVAIEERAEYLKAARNASSFNDLVNQKMHQAKASSEEDRNKVIAMTRKRIDELARIFNDQTRN